MFLDIIKIEMFHVSEAAQVKGDHDGDHFATAHSGLSLGLMPQKMFFY